MRVFLFITFALLCTICSFGKDNSYSGWITVDGKKIDFSVSYSIAKNNLITGTSLTAKGTSDETKCKIRGKYNKKTGGIYFYETVVISSKAKFENLNFCLLSARLKKKTTSKEIIYSGNFTGYVRGTKKKCASGKMLIKKKKLTQKAAPIVKKQKMPRPIVVKDTLYSNIKSKKTVRYTVTGKEIMLRIWDDANVDGDRVNIFFDGKKILYKHKLQKDKKELLLKLPLGQKKFGLKIEAINEGKASPNTSRIQLVNKGINRSLRAHIKKNDAVYITLQR